MPNKDKNAIKVKKLDGLKKVEFAITDEIFDRTNQSFFVILENSKMKISLGMNPSQISHYFYYKNNVPNNFYETPYDHFVNIIKSSGGRITDITINKNRYEVPIATITYEVGDRKCFISNISAGDAVIYSMISGTPIKMLSEYLESVRTP